MPGDVSKADLFRRLGLGGAHDLLEAALLDAGLSRPGKERISAAKEEAVRAVLEEAFVAVCTRGDCRTEAVPDGRIAVPAATPGDCGLCGGSANARAVERLVAAFRAAGLRRVCVVGGSPNARTEIERLIRGRLELRLVDGTATRTRKQADTDVAWADRVAVWGATQLDHKVSTLYSGPRVVGLARRSIQELARALVRSVEGATRAPPRP